MSRRDFTMRWKMASLSMCRPFQGAAVLKSLRPSRSEKGRKNTGSLPLGSDEAQQYTDNPIVNEIRLHLESWRALPNPGDSGVSQRLHAC